MKFLILLIGLISPLFSYAEDYMSIHPPRIADELSPGETKEYLLTIRNNGKNKVINYEVGLQEFLMNKDGSANVRPGKEKNTQSLVDFSRLDRSMIKPLGKGETDTVKLLISVPKDFKGSGYLGYYLREKKIPGKKVSGIKIEKVLYGFAMINIKGQQSRSFDVSNLNYKNNKLTVDLKNTGNAYVNSSVKAVLSSGGKVVGRFDLQDAKGRQTFFSFPKQSKNLSVVIPKKSLGTYKNLRVNILITDIKNKYIESKVLELNIK